MANVSEQVMAHDAETSKSTPASDALVEMTTTSRDASVAVSVETRRLLAWRDCGGIAKITDCTATTADITCLGETATVIAGGSIGLNSTGSDPWESPWQCWGDDMSVPKSCRFAQGSLTIHAVKSPISGGGKFAVELSMNLVRDAFPRHIYAWGYPSKGSAYTLFCFYVEVAAASDAKVSKTAPLVMI
jgi:hypothetical protein